MRQKGGSRRRKYARDRKAWSPAPYQSLPRRDERDTRRGDGLPPEAYGPDADDEPRVSDG